MADKDINTLTKTEKVAIILQALNKEGYNDNQASKLMQLSRSRISQVGKAIKHGLVKPGLVKKAKKSLEMLLEGKSVGDMSEVKGSDVLGAIKMIADRYDPPVVKTQNTNISATIDVTPQEREKYRKLLGMRIIEAEFEKVEQKQLENK